MARGLSCKRILEAASTPASRETAKRSKRAHRPATRAASARQRGSADAQRRSRRWGSSSPHQTMRATASNTSRPSHSRTEASSSLISRLASTCLASCCFQAISATGSPKAPSSIGLKRQLARPSTNCRKKPSNPSSRSLRKGWDTKEFR